MIPLNLRITCKLCQRQGTIGEFKETCDQEGCRIDMARRRGRKGKPAAIAFPTSHDPHCVCARCLDSGATQLERELEKAWHNYNQEEGVTTPNIHVHLRESPVIGPYDGKDTDEARFVTCPMGIVGNITPRGKRRK